MNDNLLVPDKVPFAPARSRRALGRQRTCDTSYQFRMGSGAAGDISRAHPASIQPCLGDPNAFPTAYGQAVTVDATTQGVRPIVAGDSGLTAIWGITCRPYPIQQSTTSNSYGEVNYGSIAPPSAQPIDVMTMGYMMVSVVGAPVKGGPVYIWYAPNSGSHVQGGFEAANTGGSTLELLSTSYYWNNGADSNGIAEIRIVA